MCSLFFLWLALRPSDIGVAALCQQLLSAGAHKSVVLAEQEEVSESNTDLASDAGDIQVSWNCPLTLFARVWLLNQDFDNSWQQALAAPQDKLKPTSVLVSSLGSNDSVARILSS